MSTEDGRAEDASPDDAAPTTECRVCQVDVPDGEFCGLCGVHLQERPGDGPEWLRWRNYGAKSDETLFTPSVASSVFPHLPPRSLTAFRVGLVAVPAALILFAVLRMPACLITAAALGLPLLFVLYLREADADADLPVASLILTAVVGIAIGVGWVLMTGHVAARTYNVPLGGGIALSRAAREGIGIPVGGAILMIVPAVVIRVMRPASREALDGFMIGALGALAFTAAATLTRLAPQLTTGLVNRNRPMSGLLVEAGIRGVAVPLTALCVGGLIGAALWFTRPPTKQHQHPGVVRFMLALFGVGVLVVYAALGMVDVQTMPQWIQLACHLLIAAVAVMLLRVGIHLSLMHEAHDEVMSDQPVLCHNCGQVVPDMPFCPACGVAMNAASRSSRQSRRDSRPVRSEGGGSAS